MAIRYLLLEVDDVDEASIREYSTPEECRENASFANSTVAGPFLITQSGDAINVIYISQDDEDDE